MPEVVQGLSAFFYLFYNFFEHILEHINGPLSGLYYNTEKYRSDE